MRDVKRVNVEDLRVEYLSALAHFGSIAVQPGAACEIQESGLRWYQVGEDLTLQGVTMKTIQTNKQQKQLSGLLQVLRILSFLRIFSRDRRNRACKHPTDSIAYSSSRDGISCPSLTHPSPVLEHRQRNLQKR